MGFNSAFKGLKNRRENKTSIEWNTQISPVSRGTTANELEWQRTFYPIPEKQQSDKWWRDVFWPTLSGKVHGHLHQLWWIHQSASTPEVNHVFWKFKKWRRPLILVYDFTHFLPFPFIMWKESRFSHWRRRRRKKKEQEEEKKREKRRSREKEKKKREKKRRWEEEEEEEEEVIPLWQFVSGYQAVCCE